jgi:tRNA 2-thiouridine synthesizing protein A
MSTSPDARVIDARGLSCPHPVLAARAALQGADAGTRILLLATDPMSPIDVAAWCARGGRRLVEERQDGDTFRFLIEQA